MGGRQPHLRDMEHKRKLQHGPRHSTIMPASLALRLAGTATGLTACTVLITFSHSSSATCSDKRGRAGSLHYARTLRCDWLSGVDGRTVAALPSYWHAPLPLHLNTPGTFFLSARPIRPPASYDGRA